MRKIYDINEFIDIMSNIKDGCFATVCYLSSAKVKKTLRGVDTDAFGADLDANRTEGDDEYYNTLKQYQSGSIKKFPYNGVVKMSKIQFHWQSEEKYGENYGKYANARDALIGKYGGEPVRRDGTDSKQEYGNGSVSIGNTDNTQGRLYSHQNGATIQNITTEYFLVDTNGQLKGGISKNAIQNIIAKSGDADGVSALRKVNATDEQIASYLEELKQLKFKVLKLMYDSILFVVATVNNEKILFWNSKLAKQVGSGSYVVQIDPQSFMQKAKELYATSYEELRESVRKYNQLIKENQMMTKKQIIRLTEKDLHNIIKESVNNILSELDWKTYQNAAETSYSRALDKDIFYDRDKFDKEMNRSERFSDAAERAFHKVHPNDHIWHNEDAMGYTHPICNYYNDEFEKYSFLAKDPMGGDMPPMRPVASMSDSERDVRQLANGAAKYTKGKGWSKPRKLPKGFKK